MDKMDKTAYIFVMEKMTASHAKQNFGELLDALARGPVAIERHKSIKAVICSPETFHGTVGDVSSPSQALAERRAARTAQHLVEKNRLIKHQKLAIDLLLMPQDKREELVLRARAEVSRWRRDRLCSTDYADRWDDLLGYSVGDLARAMCSETLEWGAALRQNSPWHVIESTTS
jgi:PHD/YefM family antitoxin component YafN of YafNO toxin-antitoxin module